MNTTYVLLIALAVAAVSGIVYLYRPGTDTVIMSTAGTPAPSPIDNTQPWPPVSPAPPNVKPIAQTVHVTLKTSQGDIDVELNGAVAPLTVGNFVHLAQTDFYDGTTFHRVIPDFMIQGGDPFSEDPTSRQKHGTGDPGYKFPDEINAESYGLHQQYVKDLISPQQLAQLPPEARNFTVKQLYEAEGYRYTTQVQSLPMKRGTLAMANAGPNTNGSQFFIITAAEVSHLNGKHTAFGVVTKGLEVLDAISAVERDATDNPLQPITITDIVVHDAPQAPLKVE